MNLRIDSAESKFYQHGKKFMNNRIHLTTRVKLLNSLVRSRLTYGCQIWTMTKEQLERITSTYNSMIRKMVRKGFRRIDGTWRYAITNDRLLLIGKTEDLRSYVARQQRQYLAHVIRHDDSSHAKMLLFDYTRARRGGKQLTLKEAVMNNEKCSLKELIRRSKTKLY